MARLQKEIAVIILAAGLGTRMKSDRAKVLHEVLGRPMVSYVVETARKVTAKNIVLVVGHQAEEVKKAVSHFTGLRFALQPEQLGTGHAVACALPSIPEDCRNVIILCGDVPLVTEKTIHRLISDHITVQRDATVLGMLVDQPTGYGRILKTTNGHVEAIIEEADASDEEKKIRVVNTGIYCVKLKFLSNALGKIRNNNAQGELYLTDIVAVGNRERRKVGVLIAENENEFHGINSKADLEVAEGLMIQR
jgi:UDP-N-acetylglucosamine diphosphorylase/glucosamine-1-phosphate N-acetyltransferase